MAVPYHHLVDLSSTDGDESNTSPPNPGIPVSETQKNQLQSLLRITYLGLVVSLSWNLFAITALWLQSGAENLTLFLAVAYWAIGVPAAYLTWYRKIDTALREEKEEFSFDRFFLVFCPYYFLCSWASVAPPLMADGRSWTGYLSAVDVYYNLGHRLVGIFYFVGFGLFNLQTVLNLLLVNRVRNTLVRPYYVNFGDGLSPDQARRLRLQFLVAYVFVLMLIAVVVIFSL